MINHKYILGILFLLFAAGVIFYSSYAGLIIIFSLIIFGALSSYWKERDLKLLALASIVLLALLNMGLNGMKFGIDFSGGTRIPVILESPASQSTMNEMVDIIKKRASTFGLTEVKVRAVGESQINVEVPSGDPALIDSVEGLLSHQGVFQGVVDGHTALSGDAILPGTIQSVPSGYLSRGSDWGVQFSVTREGAEHFASTAEGKANYPLYMYLDRPSNAIVLLSWEEASSEVEVKDRQLVSSAFSKALELEDENITAYILDELEISELEPRSNETKAIVSQSLEPEVGQELEGQGFELMVVDDEEIAPAITQTGTGEFIVSEWKAVGLLSSPVLNPSVTVGTPNYGYVISGGAEGTGSQKQMDAYEKSKSIESILKGGALPIQISTGSKTTIPAPLGKEFLNLSMIGIFIALVAISIFVSLRYRKTNILLPIIAISVSELLILLSILGSFTIDLAAMAGIIAAIGVGVDAQIVITDELMKKNQGSKQDRLEKAFDIITTNVTVAIFAMVPLLFSGMVEVIGFAISTIMGSLLGLLISRPAYAALVEDIAED
ncbi:hypothetical protein GF415_03170 [Candidatus Micrarchaeota archaeon]|nr:hypothetical protein [Candidatus Micrarchaeota archaeon]